MKRLKKGRYRTVNSGAVTGKDFLPVLGKWLFSASMSEKKDADPAHWPIDNSFKESVT
jgi:hypothetical protein